MSLLFCSVALRIVSNFKPAQILMQGVEIVRLTVISQADDVKPRLLAGRLTVPPVVQLLFNLQCT